MTKSSRWVSAAALASLMLAATAGRAADEVAPAVAQAAQPSAWQHRKSEFTYMGFTSAYSCDGLEGKVSTILRFFGARNPKVTASGCPRGPDYISHTIWLNVEFDTLSAAAADTPANALVQARWTPIKLNAQRPFFMGAGDCELIDDMKPMLLANFSFQKLSYDATCTPHQVSFTDFRVDGEVLKSVQEHAG